MDRPTLLIAVWLVLGSGRADAQPVQDVCVSSMQARTFQTRTGKLSDLDVSAPGHAGFWNNPAYPDASNALLVTVELSGPPEARYNGTDSRGTKRSVKLVAVNATNDRIMLSVTQTVPKLNEQGKSYASFLIYHDGCTTIRLRATIVGKKDAKLLERRVVFACGE